MSKHYLATRMKTYKAISVIVITLLIPLTVLVVQQTQIFTQQAAGGIVEVHAESDTAIRTGPVSVGSDTLALGGKYIQFGGSVGFPITRHTYIWNPPSPDPSGIAYNPLTGRLLISDGEVEEMTIFAGKNVFDVTLTGSLVNTASTTSFSNEPTDVTVNPQNGHIFFTDDDRTRIFELSVGNDGKYGTADDTVVRTLVTTTFGCADPEGITYADGKLYIADGSGSKVHILSSGVNGIFDGVAPTGDDQVTSFATGGLGQTDPEGIEYNPDTGTIYLVSNNNRSNIAEVTTTGTLVRNISIATINPLAPAGIALAPASNNPLEKHLYIVARGVDNDNAPTENDGELYEIVIP